MSQKLPLHLAALESEAIFIPRETAAELSKPVLPYSVGKDSSVLLHPALKAFFPATIDDIIAELSASRQSERSIRSIDHDEIASMGRKKRNGYFR